MRLTRKRIQEVFQQLSSIEVVEDVSFAMSVVEIETKLETENNKTQKLLAKTQLNSEEQDFFNKYQDNGILHSDGSELFTSIQKKQSTLTEILAQEAKIAFVKIEKAKLPQQGLTMSQLRALNLFF